MGLGRNRTTPTPEQAAWVEPPLQGMVASAARVEIKTAGANRKKKPQADWQTEGWHHFNRCGELQAAAKWMANSLSRIRLYAAEVGPDGRPGAPTTNVQAQAIASGLFGGPGAAAQVLAAIGVHLTIPGDCYIVCEEDLTSPEDDWYVISTTELVKKNGKLGIDRGDGWRALDPDASVLIRVWNPHPQKREEATSATRAVLPVLRELEKYDSHVEATLDSRLAGAGVLFVPDNIQFKAASAEQQAANNGVDPFLLSLTEAMVTAMEDRESPAAVVPLIARVPAETLQSIQHITFGTELNATIKEGREECIRRLALGLDMPPEELLGKGDTNHWSSWQIEEGGVKVHVEPKAITICSALTDSYFRPALKAAGITDPERYVLWYDITELVLRPNRADAAKQLFDAGELSAEVMLREAGFDPKADAPDKAERTAALLTKLVLAHPEFAVAILPALGITALGTQPAEQPAISAPANRTDQPAAPAPTETPAGSFPGTEPTGDTGTPAQAADGGEEIPVFSAREIAVEQLVSRGLEFAGKRLLTRGRRGQYGDVDVRRMYQQDGINVAPTDVARLLEGAWAYLPEVAGQVGLDPVRLQRHLADHVGGLLTTGQPHTAQYSRTIVRLAS